MELTEVNHLHLPVLFLMAEEAADLPPLLENMAPASVSNATSKLDVAGHNGHICRLETAV